MDQKVNLNSFVSFGNLKLIFQESNMKIQKIYVKDISLGFCSCQSWKLELDTTISVSSFLPKLVYKPLANWFREFRRMHNLEFLNRNISTIDYFSTYRWKMPSNPISCSRRKAIIQWSVKPEKQSETQWNSHFITETAH